MTEHTHTEVVPGCYRCELGAAEVTVPAITVLGMHMDALATLLVNSGDLTPQGARIIRRAVREHLPGVTFEGDE